MARPRRSFTLYGSLEIAGREEIFLYGELSSNAISVGDVVQVSTCQPPLEATISAVEMVDGTPSGSHLALGLKVPSADRDRWKNLPERTKLEVLSRG